ncbi:MAG: hypothetical protein JNM21_10340 [Taibaiella sp.]|nr:hypothetical protein [Taibaiella sp.]
MLQNLFFLLLFSEDATKFQPKIDSTIYCAKSNKVVKRLEHALIEYDDMTNTIFSKISYYPKYIYITSNGFKITNKKVYNKDTIAIIQSYLQQFYVDESETIELKRTKIEGPITGEYSTIKITLYYKNAETEVFSNKIGSEDYIIEYNPKFISFLKFIEEIVM